MRRRRRDAGSRLKLFPGLALGRRASDGERLGAKEIGHPHTSIIYAAQWRTAFFCLPKCTELPMEKQRNRFLGGIRHNAGLPFSWRPHAGKGALFRSFLRNRRPRPCSHRIAGRTAAGAITFPVIKTRKALTFQDFCVPWRSNIPQDPQDSDTKFVFHATHSATADHRFTFFLLRMMQSLCPAGDQHVAAPAKSKAPEIKFQSIWVLVGFTFWFGFYLGALMMHAIAK